MRRLKATLCAAALICCFFSAGEARADWEPAGAISAGLPIDVGGEDTRVGGLVLIDLYKPLGDFRLGLAGGLGVLSRGEDETSRLYAPLGLSLAYRIGGERIGAHLTARAGVFGGADFEGLIGGAFVSGGASLDIRFGTLALALGVDYWGLFGGGSRSLVTPMISLRWNPETL
ncbi:MAG: hypothetical protein AB8H86_15120 [Polyangiales bacterium]